MTSTLALAMRLSLGARLFRGDCMLPERSTTNTNSPHEANEDIAAWGNSGYRLSITTGSAIRDASAQWTDRHYMTVHTQRVSLRTWLTHKAWQRPSLLPPKQSAGVHLGNKSAAPHHGQMYVQATT